MATAKDLEAIQQKFIKNGWLLVGEEIKAVYPADLVIDANLPIKIGILYVTNYQIIFTITTKKEKILFTVPMGSIHRVKENKKRPSQLDVHSKHEINYSFVFFQDKLISKAISDITKYAFPANSHQLYAYIHHALTSEAPMDIFSIQNDYKRLGLDNAERFKELDNTKFTYCDTYPEYLVVPSKASAEDIKAVCAFRSRSRIPAIVWKHPVNGALLVRCV